MIARIPAYVKNTLKPIGCMFYPAAGNTRYTHHCVCFARISALLCGLSVRRICIYLIYARNAIRLINFREILLLSACIHDCSTDMKITQYAFPCQPFGQSEFVIDFSSQPQRADNALMCSPDQFTYTKR